MKVTELNHLPLSVRVPIEPDNPSIMRWEEKCIRCGMCKTACTDLMGVHGTYTLEQTGDRAVCIYCGQCANVCPVDSITERDESPAVRQAVEIILWTQRFLWQIYRPYTGMDYRNLVGLDAGYVGIELKRRLLDALLVDDRVTGIENYTYTVENGALYATFTVTTVYGGIDESVEVRL